MYIYRRVVVKIGSNVLTRKDGTLDITRMSALVDQMAELHKAGLEVILVSSGAVAAGRSEIQASRKLGQVEQRQLYSAIGQAILINRYYDLFRDHNIVCGQILTTKENFADRRHYLNQKNCMEVMLENKVIPIVNENDTVSVTELMFTDNDELSGLIAGMMNAEVLLILSNVDGIFKGHPDDPEAELIEEILPKQELRQYISADRSSTGRGGMRTKYNIASKLAKEGIRVIIANGKKDNIIPDLFSPKPRNKHSLFLPAEKTSAIKKWIAHSEGFAKGEVHINQGCTEALTQAQASLLPVGIERIEGEFEKGDIVRVIDHEGRQIGVGMIRCDSNAARNIIGSKGQKALIHYDYLYLE